MERPLFAKSLGVIIPRGLSVSGHVVLARFRETLSPGRLSRIHHRNALTEKAWEGVAQGLGNT